jgi:hypothetical protein
MNFYYYYKYFKNLYARVGVLWKVPDAGTDAIFGHVDGNRFEWSSAAILEKGSSEYGAGKKHR